MVLMQLGEVVFGCVGSGLHGMIVFAVIVVFIAGLMVGRTPEYLGKKIEAFETKMCSLVIMVPLFAARLVPRRIIPVHGERWDESAHDFPNLCRLRDGEALRL